MKKIDHILFWKRRPDSVEEIQSIQLDYRKGCFFDDVGNKYSKAEGDELIHTLFDVLKIEETENDFKAFLFENDKENYQIKFFLEIAYDDATYLAIKGTQPFHQKNYKEIQSLFQPYLEKKN